MNVTKQAPHLLRPLLMGVAGAAISIAPVALNRSATTLQASPNPCINGVAPWNPYVVNCNLPGRTGPKIRGAAPDAGAIIACRGRPACLSWYVNNP